MKRGRKPNAEKTTQITLRLSESEKRKLSKFGETPQKAIHRIILEKEEPKTYEQKELERILRAPWVDR